VLRQICIEVKRSRLLKFLVFAIFFASFCSAGICYGIPRSQLLAEKGIPGTGIIVGLVPSSGHIGPKYIYAFAVNRRVFYGQSDLWSATQHGTYSGLRLGDSVSIFYVAETPAVNLAGNPRSYLHGMYAMCCFFALMAIAAGLAAAIILRRRIGQDHVGAFG